MQRTPKNLALLAVLAIGATIAIGAAAGDRLKIPVQLGQGQAVTEKMSFDIGSGSANPFVQSTSGGTLQLSSDGTHLLSVGLVTGTASTVAGTETLTNKTLTSPAITTPTITGGTLTALTGMALRDTSAAFDVTIGATSSTTLTAGRALTLDMVDGARTVKLAGNLSLAGALTTSGAFGITLTATNTTSVTLPTAGTLSTLAGSETLTNKDISSSTNTYRAIGQSTSGVDTSQGQRHGTNTNDTASAGNIGELLSSSVTTNSPNQSSPVGSTIYDVSGVSLTPTAGDWDIDYQCQAWIENTAGATSAYVTLSLRSGASTLEDRVSCGATSTDMLCAAHGTLHTQTDGTKTYKLSVAWNTFSGSPTITAISCRGDLASTTYIHARRVR